MDSARTDSSAQHHIRQLLDSATAAVSDSPQQADNNPQAVAFITRATARIQAAANASKDPQQALLEAVAMVASDARQADASDPTSDNLTAQGWSVDHTMQAVWQHNYLTIYNTLTTVSSALYDPSALRPTQRVPEANPQAGRPSFKPGLSTAQMAMAEATIADWRTTTVGYAALAMYRVAGHHRDLDGMKTAIAQMSLDVVAAELTSLLRPSHRGDEALQSVYRRFKTAWTQRSSAAPDSPDTLALAAAEESARSALTTHPVGIAADAGLTVGRRLGGLWLSDQERVTAAIHERIMKIPPALVVETLQASPTP